MDKQEIRERIWKEMEERNIARFPRPVHGRIPNFVGAEEAARKLAELDEWKDAKVIKSNPDSPQRPVRENALKEGKIVYMAVPKLKELKCFIELDPRFLGSNISKASTIKGAFKYGWKCPSRRDEDGRSSRCWLCGSGQKGWKSRKRWRIF